MKYQNIKLLNLYYLLLISFDKEKVKNLLDYILIEPKDDDYKQGRRYPFIASEILNSDSNKIFDLFFDKSIATKNIDISNKNSIDIVESNQKSKDVEMGSFSFEEKIDTPKQSDLHQVKEKHSPKEAIINTIADHINFNTEEVIIQKNNDKETKLDQPNIDQDDKMVIDDKPNEIKTAEETMKENTLGINQEKITVDDAKEIASNIQIYHQESKFYLKIDTKEDVKMIVNEAMNEEIKKTHPEKEKIDLLDYFLSFLDNNMPLNYVLCGYFSKFFLTLFNKNSTYVSFLVKLDIKLHIY